MTEKSFNAEEDDDEDQAEVKVGPSKTRSSETTTVSASNLVSDHSRAGSVKEAHYHRNKSNEDVKEDHEECKSVSLFSSCYKKDTFVYLCLFPNDCEPLDRFS